MASLFPIAPVYPEGFRYLPGFITEEEETRLLTIIGRITRHPFVFQGFEAKRRVASFGYDYRFDTARLVRGPDIPEAFQPLIYQVAATCGLPAADFAELLITEYPSGSVINWHRDAPPFDLVAGISLSADCTFRLRPYDKAKQVRGSVLSLPVLRRSLYILNGPSRTDWQHSIAADQETRYSITLRTLRVG